MPANHAKTFCISKTEAAAVAATGPFILAPRVLKKLDFIHGLVRRVRNSWPAKAASSDGNGASECNKAVGPCDVYTSGKYWDIVAHDVADYVTQKGYGSRITGVWVGDDAETSWDTWTTTAHSCVDIKSGKTIRC